MLYYFSQWFRKVNKYTKILSEAQKTFSPELFVFSPLAPLAISNYLTNYFILGRKVMSSGIEHRLFEMINIWETYHSKFTLPFIKFGEFTITLCAK